MTGLPGRSTRAPEAHLFSHSEQPSPLRPHCSAEPPGSWEGRAPKDTSLMRRILKGIPTAGAPTRAGWQEACVLPGGLQLHGPALAF